MPASFAALARQYLQNKSEVWVQVGISLPGGM